MKEGEGFEYDLKELVDKGFEVEFLEEAIWNRYLIKGKKKVLRKMKSEITHIGAFIDGKWRLVKLPNPFKVEEAILKIGFKKK